MAINSSTKKCLADGVDVASSFFQRAWGLLGRANMEKGEGLFIPGCRSIHTFFMRFPIDIVFLDRDSRVTKTVDSLVPFRMASGPWRTTGVLELPGGTMLENRCNAGDEISLSVQGEGI